MALEVTHALGQANAQVACRSMGSADTAVMLQLVVLCNALLSWCLPASVEVS
jgi:hypothetical protein